MNTFDKNNTEHIRCVRDVEMEQRLDKWTSPPDEYSDIRQYVRDVINGKEQNDDVKKIYQYIANLIMSASWIPVDGSDQNNTMSAIELASQCWCDAETSNIQMDGRLAKAFAKRLADKMISINQLEQKIQKLIDAGDVMYTLLDPPSISMRTTEYDNALQGWDDAKIKS